MRLDRELVARSLVTSRTLAAKLIAAGEVSVNGTPVTKSSFQVGESDRIEIADSELARYVSRAGHKLAGALAAFGEISVAGARCLDAGASTGGFTDVLLRSGAAEVAAVDVGHDQLVESLRNDPRVHVYEGMNVRYLTPTDIGGQVRLTVSDLSFISLTLVIPALAAATEAGGDLLLMVKPQFEVGPHQLGRGGVVRDEAVREKAVDRVAAVAAEHGLTVRGRQPSPLPGQDGNVEYFLWCTKN